MRGIGEEWVAELEFLEFSLVHLVTLQLTAEMFFIACSNVAATCAMHIF